MKKVVFAGGCDITAICRYIKRTSNIKIVDFNSTGTWLNCISHYWVQALDNIKITDYQKYGVYYPNTDPFLDNDVDILVISILLEIGKGLYRNKNNGAFLLWGFANVDATKNPNFYAEGKEIEKNSVLESIVNDYEFLGEINYDDVVKNYKRIIQSLNSHARIYIILGPTFESAYGEKNYFFQSTFGSSKYNSLNKKMMAELGCFKNVIFIDPAKFYIKPRKLKQLFYYNFPSITHYSRLTYIGIASYLSRRHISIKLSVKETVKLILGYFYSWLLKE